MLNPPAIHKHRRVSYVYFGNRVRALKVHIANATSPERQASACTEMAASTKQPEWRATSTYAANKD
jgi:hypothetical protein